MMTRLIVALAALVMLCPAPASADIAAPLPPETQGIMAEPVQPDPGVSSSRVAPSREMYMGCPEDARICPDGSAVVRGGPDCTFPPCPGPGDDARGRRAAPPHDRIACSMDAKLCPDGSSVGRTGPDCTFPPCPGEGGGGGGAMPSPMPPQPEPMPPEQPIRPLQQSLQIDPNDAQCVHDSECVMVHTTCGGCDCGTPVNQMFALKYKDRLMKMCVGAPPIACGMACRVPDLACKAGRCTTR